jgi:ribonuclease P protein component
VLAAEHRLRDGAAFRRTVRSGRRAGGGALVAHLLTDETSNSQTDPGAPAPRVGFVVSKAVGNAVVRNRVKRRLRHLARGHVAELAPGTELVIRALPAAAALSSAELEVELARCLQRAREGSGPRGRSGGGRSGVRS